MGAIPSNRKASIQYRRCFYSVTYPKGQLAGCGNPPSEYKTLYWINSTVVLKWLSRPACTWTTYVAKRVAKVEQKPVVPCEIRRKQGRTL